MTEHGNFRPERKTGNEEVAFLQAKLGVMGVIIEELRRRRSTETKTRSLLDRLSVSQKVICDPKSTKHRELVKALRRTAQLGHPDSHPEEPLLVQQILTATVIPVTEALNTLRKPRKVSG